MILLNVILVAGLSAVHFLVGVKHEVPVTVTEGDVTSSNSCPGLSEFLKCLTKKSAAEMYSLFGRTPLLQAIAVKHQSAAQSLVGTHFVCFPVFGCKSECNIISSSMLSC